MVAFLTELAPILRLYGFLKIVKVVNQLMRHSGSLGHAFALGTLVVQVPIRLPFALALYPGCSVEIAKTIFSSDPGEETLGRP